MLNSKMTLKHEQAAMVRNLRYLMSKRGVLGARRSHRQRRLAGVTPVRHTRAKLLDIPLLDAHNNAATIMLVCST